MEIESACPYSQKKKQMTCKNNENDYPGLYKVLHLASKDLESDHPLFTLMHSDNSAIREMLKHTDICAEQVLAINQTWLKSKANKLMRNKTTANLSAILAEIRAYHDLIQVWGLVLWLPGPMKFKAPTSQ